MVSVILQVEYGENWYMRMELENVLVTSYSAIGETSTEPPKECFTLSYSKIRYSVNDYGTTVEASWDLTKNKPLA